MVDTGESDNGDGEGEGDINVAQCLETTEALATAAGEAAMR